MGEILQSEQWRKFQEAVDRRTFRIETESISANIIEHRLPIVGRYGYMSRGPHVEFPISNFQFPNNDQNPIRQPADKIQNFLTKLIKLAKENGWGWVRFDPATNEILGVIKNSTKLKLVKAPHDMQPRQVLVVDISESHEAMMAKMKSKTRYNIRLAQKRGVTVTSHQSPVISKDYVEEFLRLTKITAKRQGIVPHPDEYYRKMLEIIPAENVSLFVAEHDRKIISAAVISFFDGTATYLHGASDDQYKNLMAPYLVQWEATLEAQKRGCTRYDLGGVAINKNNDNWSGITKFKLGFAPETRPIEFPGSYDLILSPLKYGLYNFLQKINSLVRHLLR